ncbi:two-component sensor histidine kinase [Kaistia hirudinis]|uniref:histidine kinase n=1 Tax=Kaistia hirudinis TaxID=1293440 RepID=A0A840ATC4_9HYPH|nr:two-component sensor histidine kinase [Kaistia hirudinis]
MASFREPPALEGHTVPHSTPDHVEAASTLAVIASSNEPLLFLDSDLRVIAASRSFCRTFQMQPETLPGTRISDLGNGEWAVPQLTSLLRATASGAAEIEAYELELTCEGHETRHLVLNAHKLDDGDADHIRLLLAISDVTLARSEARQKDDLVRQKAILLQEVQHRVANSLQIIASVLMHSARKVQSEEARGHLQSAHHRVMSIAAVQRQLAASELGQVVLAPYLVQLCDSLGASMIRDPRRLSIAVEVDDSLVDAKESLSLGLIVTELVINALKHAFPGHRKGRIVVGYRSEGPDWMLSVSDNGIGIPDGVDAPKPGLGTGIVDALAGQLNAKIRIVDTQPGTAICVESGCSSEIGRPVSVPA